MMWHISMKGQNVQGKHFFSHSENHLSRDSRNRSSGFSTRSDTNRAVQLQMIGRCLKFRILEEEGLYYLCSKKKALISCAVTAQLICGFVFAYAKAGFLMTCLICKRNKAMFIYTVKPVFRDHLNDAEK